jgi:hypothetical protein
MLGAISVASPLALTALGASDGPIVHDPAAHGAE